MLMADCSNVHCNCHGIDAVWTRRDARDCSGVDAKGVNSATLLFLWLGKLGTVLLEHEKFCARNMANVW